MIAEFYGGLIDGNRYGVDERLETIVYEERSVPVTVWIDEHVGKTTIAVKHHFYRRFCVLPDRCVYVSMSDPRVKHWWDSLARRDASVVYAICAESGMSVRINSEMSVDIAAVSESMLAAFEGIAERKNLSRKKKLKKV